MNFRRSVELAWLARGSLIASEMGHMSNNADSRHARAKLMGGKAIENFAAALVGFATPSKW